MFNTNDNLEYANIVCLEADANYTRITYKGGTKDMKCRTLKTFEPRSKLYGFVRLNKSLIVNMEYILHVCLKRKVVTLKDQSEVKIARRRVREAVFEITYYSSNSSSTLKK